MSFNPLNYPICFEKPQRLTDVTSWHEHIPFAFTIMQMLKPKIFIELGTHKGDSYCAFCQAVNVLGLDTACYAVDTWEGDEHSGFYGSEILEELKTYHDSRYMGFSQLIQSLFEEALDYFSDGSIDLIHIDGCHTYNAVKHDFEAWLPKMSQYGVVLFHDINVHEREFGVWKFWEEVAEYYPCFEFKHGYGLGVLAVGAEVPEEVLAFLNMEEQEVVTTTKLYSYLGDKIALGHQLQVGDIQITEINSAMQARDTKINEINSAMQTRDTNITELNSTLQARDTKINEINSALQARDTKINEINSAMQTRDTNITELNSTLQARDTKINEINSAMQTRNTNITELNSTLQARDAQITDINSKLQARDGQIKDLETTIHQNKISIQEKQAQVAQLLSSKSWRWTYLLRLIHSSFFSLKSLRLTAPLKWIHSKILQSKIWRFVVILSKKSPREIWALSNMYLRLYGIRGALVQITKDIDTQQRFDRKTDVQEIANLQMKNVEDEDDWQVYQTQSQKIAEAKKENITKFHPKALKIISVDEAHLVTHAKSLKFQAVERPKVSIIIPVYNNEKLTIECLTSILKNTKGVSYEIIVIDDGSTEKMQEIISQIRNITYIKNTDNLGFLLSCNRAAEKAQGEFILFLNNDAQVMKNWLIPLVETFSEFENVGAVGSKVLYPNGRLQEAGALINKDISATMIGLFDDPELQKYNYVREVVYCSGVCLILSTKIFREHGGFDVSYAPGYYEDADLCFRLRNKGLRIFYNPKSVIVHHLSATSNNIDGSYKQQCIIRNQQKFSEKWQKQIDDLNDIRLIAFFLPQYHTIPENDRWWGKGFTEWTNVTKARPNFEGHYQPRLPSDLGYYDLRVGEVMEQQAELAKKYGIHGFCYYYYWFGGKRLLDMPLERMLKTGKPNIPFCLCWANENWTRKWDGLNDKILIEQQHSDEDDRAVIIDIMRYMQHPNYIRINGKPLLFVYRISLFPNIKRTAKIWRDLCRKEGIGEIYLAMVESFEHSKENVGLENSFDASVEFPPHNMSSPIKPTGMLLNPDYAGTVSDYREIVLKYSLKEKPGNVCFRTVMPSWDNTARQQDNSYIFANASPGAYQAWLETALDLTHEQNLGDERIVFINAWNEWAEGNYLEPDRRFGHGFLEATRNAIERAILKRK